jgi:protein-disulfide isomerase
MFLFVVSLFCYGSALVAQSEPEVIAVVGGSNITRGDLERAEGGKLLQARYQSYLAEQKALEQMIDNRVLEMEAAAQKLTVADLIAREVASKIQNPTDEQLRLYYDDLNIKEPFEQVRDKMLEHVRQSRTNKQRAAYVEQLRTKYTILITLAPPRVDVAVGDAPRLGPADAALKVVEFADYECPYCAKVNPHVRKLHEEFGNQINVYFKDLPLPMHSHAQKAAEAARCARQQNKFWEYHDMLFSERRLDPDDLKKYARSLNLDTAKFDECLDSGAQADAVKKDLGEGQQLGIAGTPAFFINGRFVSGAVDYSTLRDIVRQQLAMLEAKGQPTSSVGK